MKRDPKSRKPPEVRKLLRVLVAGGVALAGAAGPVAGAADEKAPSEKADPAATTKPEAKPSAKKQPPKKDASKKEPPKKASSDDAGGVKGW